MKLNQIPAVIMIVLMAAMILTFGLIMLSRMGTTAVRIAGANSAAVNATNDTITALAEITDYWGIIIFGIMFSILIAIILTAFTLGKRGGGP